MGVTVSWTLSSVPQESSSETDTADVTTLLWLVSAAASTSGAYVTTLIATLESREAQTETFSESVCSRRPVVPRRIPLLIVTDAALDLRKGIAASKGTFSSLELGVFWTRTLMEPVTSDTGASLEYKLPATALAIAPSVASSWPFRVAAASFAADVCASAALRAASTAVASTDAACASAASDSAAFNGGRIGGEGGNGGGSSGGDGELGGPGGARGTGGGTSGGGGDGET